MKKQRKNNVIQVLFISSGMGIALILLLSMLFGMLVIRGILPESFFRAAGAAAVIFGTVTAAVITCMQSKEKKLILTMADAMLLLLVMLLIHSLAFHGIPYQFAMTGGCAVGSAAITGVAMSLKKKKRRY